MILPTKHITVRDSLLGVGALLLVQLEKPLTESELWERVRDQPEITTFERFTLALDLLYMVGAIEFRKNKLWRSHI
jgi:hypothetical protein